MNENKMPWRETRGFKLSTITTGNGRVDDDFKVPGYFITKDQAEAMWDAVKIIIELDDRYSISMAYSNGEAGESLEKAIGLLKKGIGRE